MRSDLGLRSNVTAHFANAAPDGAITWLLAASSRLFRRASPRQAYRQREALPVLAEVEVL